MSARHAAVIAFLGTMCGAILGLIGAGAALSWPLDEFPTALAQSSFDQLVAWFGLWIGGAIGLCFSTLGMSIRSGVNVARCILVTTVVMIPIVIVCMRRLDLDTPFPLAMAIVMASALALFYLQVGVHRLRARRRMAPL